MRGARGLTFTENGPRMCAGRLGHRSTAGWEPRVPRAVDPNIPGNRQYVSAPPRPPSAVRLEWPQWKITHARAPLIHKCADATDVDWLTSAASDH